MGHSENRGRRGLTRPLQPRAKLIGLSILVAGLASLITSAQLDPIMGQVERVIDGDIQPGPLSGKDFYRPAHRRGHPGKLRPRSGVRASRVHAGRSR